MTTRLSSLHHPWLKVKALSYFFAFSKTYLYLSIICPSLGAYVSLSAFYEEVAFFRHNGDIKLSQSEEDTLSSSYIFD